MIKTKPKKLDLISAIIIILTLVMGCGTKNKIFGVWKVQDIHINIKDDMRYLQESDPGLLEGKFHSKFPKRLKTGDFINFNKKGELIVNKQESFQYSLATSIDSLMYVKSTDVVFPIAYKIENNILILSRSLHQGRIEWKLIRKIKKR